MSDRFEGRSISKVRWGQQNPIEAHSLILYRELQMWCLVIARVTGRAQEHDEGAVAAGTLERIDETRNVSKGGRDRRLDLESMLADAM